MDTLVERVIAQFTSRSVGLTSDVSLKQAEDKTFAFLLVLRLHLQRLRTSISVRRILSKGFADGTLRPRAQGPVVYLPIFEKKARSH